MFYKITSINHDYDIEITSDTDSLERAIRLSDRIQGEENMSNSLGYVLVGLSRRTFAMTLMGVYFNQAEGESSSMNGITFRGNPDYANSSLIVFQGLNLMFVVSDMSKQLYGLVKFVNKDINEADKTLYKKFLGIYFRKTLEILSLASIGLLDIGNGALNIIRHANDESVDSKIGEDAHIIGMISISVFFSKNTYDFIRNCFTLPKIKDNLLFLKSLQEDERDEYSLPKELEDIVKELEDIVSEQYNRKIINTTSTGIVSFGTLILILGLVDALPLTYCVLIYLSLSIAGQSIGCYQGVKNKLLNRKIEAPVQEIDLGERTPILQSKKRSKNQIVSDLYNGLQQNDQPTVSLVKSIKDPTKLSNCYLDPKECLESGGWSINNVLS